MAVLHDFGFDMAVGFMNYSRSCDVEWPLYMSSWFPNDFSMSELFDVLSRIASSNRDRNSDGEPIEYRVFPVLTCSFCENGCPHITHHPGTCA